MHNQNKIVEFCFGHTFRAQILCWQLACMVPLFKTFACSRLRVMTWCETQLQKNVVHDVKHDKMFTPNVMQQTEKRRAMITHIIMITSAAS